MERTVAFLFCWWLITSLLLTHLVGFVVQKSYITWQCCSTDTIFLLCLLQDSAAKCPVPLLTLRRHSTLLLDRYFWNISSKFACLPFFLAVLYEFHDPHDCCWRSCIRSILCQCRRQTQMNLTTCHLHPALAASYAATTRSLTYHMSATSDESLFIMPSVWTTELPLAIEQIQISLTDFKHNPKLPLLVIFLRSKVLLNDRADGL